MSELVLHHYEISPFSAKIRSMLGYCGLQWRSVLTAPMPPRPRVDALAGGYRRIPVAQIGADVFCDTRIISDEIAGLAGLPELSATAVSPEQRALADHAETDVFFACVSQAAGWHMTRRLLGELGATGVLRMLRDRIGVVRTMREPRVGLRGSDAILRRHLEQLESRLSEDFLFGSRPTIADFSAWHSMWFVTDVGGRDLLSAYPRLQAWAAKIAAFDNGDRLQMSPDDAVAQARESQPRELPGDTGEDPLLGKNVSIAPSDYACAAVNGKLVASLPHRFILQRQTEETGVVHVHFPRERFEVCRADNS